MKDDAIRQSMASIENRVRHVYNQGFEAGRKAERKTMTHEEAVGFLQESGWLQDHDRQIYEQGKREGIEERKTGRWIAQKVANSWSDYKCSECGRILTVLYSFGDIPTVSDVANDYPFCHCGAKMEGAEE